MTLKLRASELKLGDIVMAGVNGKQPTKIISIGQDDKKGWEAYTRIEFDNGTGWSFIPRKQYDEDEWLLAPAPTPTETTPFDTSPGVVVETITGRVEGDAATAMDAVDDAIVRDIARRHDEFGKAPADEREYVGYGPLRMWSDIGTLLSQLRTVTAERDEARANLESAREMIDDIDKVVGDLRYFASFPHLNHSKLMEQASALLLTLKRKFEVRHE